MDVLEEEKKKAQPSIDHWNLSLWVWACLHDAEAYLESSSRFYTIATDPQRDWLASMDERVEAQRLMELEKYHFVMTMGRLCSCLERLAPLFPTIQSAYDAAIHLRKEGRTLRNMIEHADQNLNAVGPRGGFVRKAGAADDLPGDSGEPSMLSQRWWTKTDIG